MKLSFGFGTSKSSRNKSTATNGTAPLVQCNLARQKTRLLLTGVLVVVLPVLVVYLQGIREYSAAQGQLARSTAEQFAGSYQQWVSQQQKAAAQIAQDKEAALLLQQSDPTVRQKREQWLTRLLPGAERVRLLPPGIDEVDMEASPPISYATLDMLSKAEAGESTLMAEVHVSDTRKYITIAQRILAPSGTQVVGNLLVSFSADELQKIFNDLSINGYAELQQVVGAGVLTLASSGDQALKQKDSDATTSVAGSRWQVVYWLPAQGLPGSTTMLAVVASSGMLAVLVLLAMIWVVFGKLSSALHRDKATLLNIVKDMRTGRVKHAYPTSLGDLHDTIELMARTASQGIPVAPVTSENGAGENEKDNESNEVVDSVDTDLLFDQKALDVGKLQVDEKKVSNEIFRAYDIRGIVGRTLDMDVAYEIGRAIGSEAYFRGEQTVVVGRDGRLSGLEMVDALIRGLKDTGRDVKNIGMVPTPVLYFAAQYLNANSGVMVTGSHNPKDYNGFKIVLGGETLAGEAIDALRLRIESADLLSGDGSVEDVSMLPDYIERIHSDVQVVRSIKIVVDCGNGVAGEAVTQLLQLLGCDVVELFCDIDGNFPNHDPDPSKPENLAALIASVKSEGAELGLAFDGDGDRLGVVTSQGDIVWPDRLMMLFAIDVLSRNPGTQVIYDVKCSRHLANVIAENGGEALMWMTGHSLIKAKMKETGALLAGEMSGHIFFKERWLGFDDGMYAAARLLEILAADPRSPDEVFAALPDSANTPELTIPMAEGGAKLFMEKLLNGAHFEDARIATIDGMRVEFDDGWGLVRASNTMPCLMLRFEGDDELALNRIQGEFRRVMLQADDSLKLPF